MRWLLLLIVLSGTADATLLEELRDALGNELPVARASWTTCEAASLFGASHPTLITGPFLRTLNWTDARLAAAHRGGALVKARVLGSDQPHSVPYFTTSGGKLPVGRAAATRKELLRLTEMPFADLLRHEPLAAKYYSTDLAAHFDASLTSEFPSECLFKRSGAVDPNGTSTHIWIGSGRPVTRLHYDGEINFFLQVRGAKEFLLLPPSELRKVALFPYLSELSRQAGVDNDDIAGGVETSLFTNVSFVRVVLEAEQMLYLPPFWLHRVAGLSDVSVSVNAWSDCEEMFAFDQVLPKIVLPFELSWPQPK
jgi:hypothetical protein